MPTEQGRDAQPEGELDALDQLPFEVPTLIQRPQPERRMHGQRRVKQQCRRQAPPQRHVEPKPVLHGFQRNIAERMVDEMTEKIGE